MSKTKKKGMPPDRFIVNRRRVELVNQLQAIQDELADLNRVDWLLDDAILCKIKIATTKGFSFTQNPECTAAIAIMECLRRSGKCH